MRIVLVSLMALAAASADAFAQTPPANTATPETAPPASTTPAPSSSPATPATAPTTPAPGAAPSATAAPPAATSATTSAQTAAPTAGTPAPAAQAAAAPPPPPAPPTDPAAIAVMNVLKKVCIPSASGGDFLKLVKAAGLRKNGDNNWVLKSREFTLVVEDPGSNPNQCHVDLTHPVDPDSPGKPIVMALNDWAAVENGWSLYRNDKSVQDGMLVTTRSWTLEWNGKTQGLVFTNMRKPDGAPLHRDADSSQIIYSVTPS